MRRQAVSWREEQGCKPSQGAGWRQPVRSSEASGRVESGLTRSLSKLFRYVIVSDDNSF